MKTIEKATMLAVLAFVACLPATAKILELERVHNFKTTFDSEHSKLHISGTIFDGVYRYKQIQVKRKKSKILILISLSFFQNAEKVDFSEEIQIPPDVESVSFGKNEAEIWKRGM